MGRGSDSVWLVKRALDCARIAVQFDHAANIDQAVMYYEKTINYIDQVMPRLSAETDTKTRLMVHRRGYDVRLSLLRPFASGSLKTSERRKSGSIAFDEIVAAVATREYEYPPPQTIQRPYWLLRVIRQTLNGGGHLTQVVYIPKGVWTQPGAMFNGLNSKVQAFHGVSCVMEGLFTLDRNCTGDVQHLRAVLEEYMHVRDDLALIQNDLSKPFTFIHEVPLRQREVVINKTRLGKVNALINTVGKNVKKYAEVGYQRTRATLPGRASDDDLQHYATMLMELCTRVQILDEWFAVIQQAKEELKSQARNGNDSADNAQAMQLLEEISAEHLQIAVFMQDCICELVLRDLEQLLVRYMRKMRKGFSRMYWTEDQPDG